MVSFSIDFLTGNDLLMDDKLNLQLSDSKLSLDDSGSDGSCRRTPSPTPSDSTGSNSSENAESIAAVLLSLDKQTGKFADPARHEKPPHSYIALISMAILSSSERRMLLSDIYQYIMDTFPYYDNKEKAWRNSIRHNLSLNECFVKSGRSDNGKGNFWSIHPACVEDFAQGDFRRRQARRRARKCMKETAPAPEMHLGYRYNLGYVPMTSSQIGYHPYAAPVYYPPPAAFAHQTVGSAPYYTSPAQTTLPAYPQNGHRRSSVHGMQQMSPELIHGLQPISYASGVQQMTNLTIPTSTATNLQPLSPSPLTSVQQVSTGHNPSIQSLSPSPSMQHLPLW